MLNILSNADTVLLNTLSGQDNTTIHPSINNLIDMNTSIGNTGISNTTTEADSNGKLYKIFKNLYTYESTISTILCTKIAKYLLKNILHATAFYNFPKDLFHGVFLEFVLKQNLFYNKQQIGIYRTCVFEKIMSSESNYFNLNFDILCIQNYISHARNLRSFINTQSMTYVILSNYEITIVLNFLDLINEVYRDDIADTEDTEDLQFEGFELYKLIYSSLANMLLLNLESSRLYDLTYMVQNYMDLSGTTIYYRNIINTLKEMEELKQLLLIYITDIDVNTATSEQIHLVAYSRNEETHIFDAYLHHKTIFKPVLVNLFKSERINIHDKCKLILTITDFEEDFIPELIRFFINLEDYNESGLKIKLKIRSKILKYTGGNKREIQLSRNVRSIDYNAYVNSLDTNLLTPAIKNSRKYYNSSGGGGTSKPAGETDHIIGLSYAGLQQQIKNLLPLVSLSKREYIIRSLLDLQRLDYALYSVWPKPNLFDVGCTGGSKQFTQFNSNPPNS